MIARSAGAPPARWLWDRCRAPVGIGERRERAERAGSDWTIVLVFVPVIVGLFGLGSGRGWGMDMGVGPGASCIDGL